MSLQTDTTPDTSTTITQSKKNAGEFCEFGKHLLRLVKRGKRSWLDVIERIPTPPPMDDVFSVCRGVVPPDETFVSMFVAALHHFDNIKKSELKKLYTLAGLEPPKTL